MGKFITLREEFESETGAHPFADQQYIEWLEKVIKRQRQVKNYSIPDVSHQRELLADFQRDYNKRNFEDSQIADQDIELFLAADCG